ncbi:MAG TPA: N-acetyltransferase [Bacillota bacterium]
MIIFRKAKMQDVERLHELINAFADKGLMLPRSLNMMYEALREFTLVEDDGVLVGAGGLHVTWDNLAEIRALAIKEEYQGKGLGKQLIEKLLQEALELGINRVFALTYQGEFFKSCGFHEVPKEQMPHKVWKECINCPKFPNCDETTMLRIL